MKSLFFCLFIFASCSKLPVALKKAARKPSPYQRVTAGIPRVCQVSQELDGYEERYIFNCNEDYSKSSRIVAGYGFSSKSGHPYTTGLRSLGRGKVARSIDMISRNHALNETYLHVIDFAGGPDSHDMKSVIYLFPRVEIPAVHFAGNEVELVLPTGEKVFFDAQTGAIKGGALVEGPIDLNPSYMNRRAPNVRYSGDFVSVRLSHRYEEPTIASGTAVITQKNNVCELPRSTLFSKAGKLMTTSDEHMLEVLNRECATPFEF